MSAHYSKFLLNTYAGTPYFQAHIPSGYQIYLELQKARAFRRLPKNIKQLSALAKRWAALHVDDETDPNGSKGWYDAEGNELDPLTGVALTGSEIDKEWEDIGISGQVTDIPIPAGGFADPEEWEPAETVECRQRPSDDQLRKDIASHGVARTALEYDIPEADLDAVANYGKMDEAYEEELEGKRTLSRIINEKGFRIPSTAKCPPLNPDGSYADGQG